MALWFFSKVVWFVFPPCWRARRPKLLFAHVLLNIWWLRYAQMCCKCYHIIFSTFSLKFKRKICVQKEVIHNLKNHILVTWPATNVLILRKWCGFEKLNHHLFKIWPTNRFLKAKSFNLHFYKNDVTWPLSANGLFPLRHDQSEVHVISLEFLQSFLKRHWFRGETESGVTKCLRFLRLVYF